MFEIEIHVGLGASDRKYFLSLELAQQNGPFHLQAFTKLLQLFFSSVIQQQVTKSIVLQ